MHNFGNTRIFWLHSVNECAFACVAVFMLQRSTILQWPWNIHFLLAARLNKRYLKLENRYGNWYFELLPKVLPGSWSVWAVVYADIRRKLKSYVVYYLCLCKELRVLVLIRFFMYLNAVYTLPGELEDWVWCQVVRHFFCNLWCLAVNVFLTCDARRGLWHHPITTDVLSLDDFNKNEKLLALYSQEDASSLWFFVVKKERTSWRWGWLCLRCNCGAVTLDAGRI